ncbi:hypothetical protein CSUI_011475 [Cystoisospora suis]|uniref:Uncharacterized protein n=1 Tax=Cystoisospora suis TaxID=483139 RepID=A0A2C6KDY3_9APIC|nr:hypothetical protein CSUI_011475 [Cystoisospora suis]
MVGSKPKIDKSSLTAGTRVALVRSLCQPRRQSLSLGPFFPISLLDMLQQFPSH